MNVKGRIVRRAYRLMVPYRLGLMRDDGLGVGWFLEMKREVNSQKSHKNNKNGNEELSILLSTAAMAGVEEELMLSQDVRERELPLQNDSQKGSQSTKYWKQYRQAV